MTIKRLAALKHNSSALWIKNLLCSCKLIFLHLSILFFISIHSVTLASESHESFDQELNEFLKLDLEALGSISVASKREEDWKEAPGVVTIITDDEIERFGYRNLRDILNRQTSIQIIGSNTFPHNKAVIRGNTSSHVDEQVLILLNGRPVRESSVSSLNKDIYAFFPVQSLKQIEIIRGPGSVLYGTNAFSGVINLISKDATSEPEASASLSYGSFNRRQFQLNGSGTLKQLEINAHLNYIDNPGDDRNNLNDEFGNQGTYKTGRQGISALMNAKLLGFTLNAFYTNNHQDNVRSFFQFPSVENDFERAFVDLGYKHHINKSWNISANLSYHEHTEYLFINAMPLISDNRGKNYLAEVNSDYAINNNLHLIAGATYRYMRNEDFFGTLNNSLNSNSIYAQGDYRINNHLKLTAGLQYNKPQGISSAVSPRIAAVITFNENWGAKLMYGEAFREGPLLDRFINIPNLQGNPSLHPESISTFDAQLYYSNQSFFAAATYFHSEVDDQIRRISGTPVRIMNQGSTQFDGFELESKWSINNAWQFIGNLSYQTNKNNMGQEDFTYSPDWMIKTGISYTSARGIQLGIFNSYFAASTLQNIQINPLTGINPPANAYNLLSANVELMPGQFFSNSKLDNLRLSLYADNLLDEDIYFPSINRTTVNSIPHHHGRGIYATMSVDF